MFRLHLAIFFLLSSYTVFAQYKNDNVLYKTVNPQDLCRELEKNPGYVLLDVRSLGEFNDTAATASHNIGHLDGALHFDSRQAGQRIRQIAAYKNEPVFIYCSHSQRSRRVSKMLADSGFTKVYNINGGLTALLALNPIDKACISSMLKTSNNFSIISSPELCRKLSAKFNSLLVLDVRPDSAWNRISSNPKVNAIGSLKGSRHIALSSLKEELSKIPKGKEIVVTDLNGTEAPLAAKMLRENGFEKVSILLEGIERWLYSDYGSWGCTANPYIPAVDFTIMSSGEFARFYPANKKSFILDLRSAAEFSNTHKDAFRNIGYLENAVNIPSGELEKRLGEMEIYKPGPIILYATSGSPDVYAAASNLVKNGFKQVYVLVGGLFNLRWTASNVPGLNFIHDWIKAVPEENL